MFNIKLPIWLNILLIITVLINIFSSVTIEYHTISFKEFRNYEIVCGNILEVINTTNIEDLSKDLRLNWSSCREKAFVILITNLVSLSFLIILLIYLVYIYKNRKEREDISDLLTILKRMNRK